MTTSAPIHAGDLELWVEQRGNGPDVLLIPNARFEIVPGQAHQPFQEVPNEFNARVDAFWREA